MSFGFAPADGEVDNSTKLAVSESIVNKLGYTNNQWIAIAHGRNDPGHDWQHNHDRLHIVINAIDFNGDRVSDSFDKTRLEQILRKLEAEHKLTKIVSSHECDRSRDKLARVHTVNEPAVGIRSMLLTQSNYSLCAIGIDINRDLLKCALVQFALYAP